MGQPKNEDCKIRYAAFLMLTIVRLLTEAAQIERIWLTHNSNDPSKIVVNRMSEESGDSVVRFGLSKDYDETVRIEESTTLLHAEIPL